MYFWYKFTNVQKKIFKNKYIFSEPDVSLNIQYKFNHTTEPATKKRKLQDNRKAQNIVDYSAIKLPAKVFIEYLEQDLDNFIKDCLR